MLSWGNKRKYIIIGVAFILLAIPFSVLVFNLIYKTPTCSDRRQNQDEQGIDCGGSCALYCPNTAADLVILWQRYFKVADGIYTAAISVQNPNLRAGAKAVPYRIRIFDTKGVTVSERLGVIDIHPKYTFPIIEPGILLGQRTPSLMTFEFLEDPVWVREEEKITPLTITREVLFNENVAPRIEAYLENGTVRDVDHVNVGVIVYDIDDNVIGVSRTVVDKVPGSGSAKAIFTWPETFPAPVSRKEILILE